MSSLESTDTPARDNSNALNPDMQTLMQMMKTMMDSHSNLERQVAELIESKQSTQNNLEESFNLKDIHLANDTFLRTPSERRSSLLLSEPKLKKDNQARHLAIATPFESNALKKKVNYLALANLRKEKRYHDSQPGNAGAQILLWQDRYIPETTRRRLLNQFKKFNDNPAKLLIDQNFRVPTEEDLFTMDFPEIFNLLEIAIIPDSPADYEEEIGDIARAIIRDNLRYTIPAQPYYLQHLLKAIESIEQYLKVAPEKDANGLHMPYNLGTKKNPMHGTKGTISAFMDNAMPPVLQHSMAKLMNQTQPANTLGQHFQLMRTAITSLEKMFNTFEHYLTACLDLAKTQRPSDASVKHLSSAIGEADENSLQTQERSYTDPISGITTEEQGTELTAALGGMPPRRTEQEIEDLKKTPCYAFIKGNCKSSTCLRSHDKKIITACLEEDLRRAKELA